MTLDPRSCVLQGRKRFGADRVEVAEREIDPKPQGERGVGTPVGRDDERALWHRSGCLGGPARNDDGSLDHALTLPPLALPRSGSRVGGAHVRPLSPVAPSSPSNGMVPRPGYSGVTYAAVSPPSTTNVAPVT